jgi:tRNA A-37 threonylcarbamoyl transferase component Bud32
MDALNMFQDELNKYIFEHDPNFDFKGKQVDDIRNSHKSEKEQNIKEYYKEAKGCMSTNDSFSTINSFISEDGSDGRSSFFQAQQGYSTVKPRRKNLSSMHLTMSTETAVEPGKMKKKPQRKLKDVCDENGYKLSMNDFEKTKIFMSKGAFGEVYLVKCKLNGCKYALKVLNKKAILKAGCERHLMREKEIQNMLNHPNISRLEAYFMDSENCYFILELCQVGDMNTFIKDHGKLGAKLTRQFTMEIVNALEHLRDHNIVHRDLKPKNILLDDTFHVKLTDFGAAKEINPEEVEQELAFCRFESDDESEDDSSEEESQDDDSDSED